MMLAFLPSNSPKNLTNQLERAARRLQRGYQPMNLIIFNQSIILLSYDPKPNNNSERSKQY